MQGLTQYKKSQKKLKASTIVKNYIKNKFKIIKQKDGNVLAD